jgi:subtilase family serine protease
MCRISRFALVAALLGVLASASVQLMEVMEKRISRESFVKIARSDAEQQHELVFAVKKLNQDKLEATVLERSTPGSALYQTWMSFHEVRAMTENKEGSAQVLSWLEQNDIKVTWTSPYKDYIKATASVATWGTLLNTQFYAFDDTSKALKGVARKYAKGEVEAKGVKSLVDGVVEGVKEAGVEDMGVTVEGVKRKNTHRCDEYSLPSTLAPHLEAVLNTVQTPPAFKPKYHRKEGMFKPIVLIIFFDVYCYSITPPVL